MSAADESTTPRQTTVYPDLFPDHVPLLGDLCALRASAPSALSPFLVFLPLLTHPHFLLVRHIPTLL